MSIGEPVKLQGEGRYKKRCVICNKLFRSKSASALYCPNDKTESYRARRSENRKSLKGFASEIGHDPALDSHRLALRMLCER